MPNYKDVNTVLDAYHELEGGRSVSWMKAAANRLRSFDTAHELLPELNTKIEAMERPATDVVSSGPQHARHSTAEMLV
jgi:hypothetical protein